EGRQDRVRGALHQPPAARTAGQGRGARGVDRQGEHHVEGCASQRGQRQPPVPGAAVYLLGHFVTSESRSATNVPEVSIRPVMITLRPCRNASGTAPPR